MQNHCSLHGHPRRTMHFADPRGDVGRCLGSVGIKNPNRRWAPASTYLHHESPIYSSLGLLFSIPDGEERSSTNGAQYRLNLGRWPSRHVNAKEQQSQTTKKEQVEQCTHSRHFSADRRAQKSMENSLSTGPLPVGENRSRLSHPEPYRDGARGLRSWSRLPALMTCTTMPL